MKTKSWTQNLGKKKLNNFNKSHISKHLESFNDFLDDIKRNDKSKKMGKKTKNTYRSKVKSSYKYNAFDKSGISLFPPIDNADERSKEIIRSMMKEMMTDEDCEDGFVCVNNVCIPDTNMDNVATGVRTGTMNGTMVSSSNINSVKAITTYDPSEFVPAITAHGYKIPKKKSWIRRLFKRLEANIMVFFGDPSQEYFDELYNKIKS